MEELLAKLKGMGGGGGASEPLFGYVSQGRNQGGSQRSQPQQGAGQEPDMFDTLAKKELARRQQVKDQTALNQSANSAGEPYNPGGLKVT